MTLPTLRKICSPGCLSYRLEQQNDYCEDIDAASIVDAKWLYDNTETAANK